MAKWYEFGKWAITIAFSVLFAVALATDLDWVVISADLDGVLMFAAWGYEWYATEVLA